MIRAPRTFVIAVCLVLSACTGGDGQRESGRSEAPPRPPVERTAGAPGADAPTPTHTDRAVAVEISVIAGNLAAPWGLAFADDRAFVTERDSGRVLEVIDEGTVEIAALQVDPAGEGGLLGIAASPRFSRDGLLYAYTTTATDNRVVRFSVDGGSPEPVVTGIPAGRIHNGGRIAFDDAGLLYVGTGDAGTDGLAQDLDSLGGKVLRVTADGTVPPDNPFAGSPVWTYGHRNVQGLAWGPGGVLYATEFGPDRDDELNVLEAGGNYGWPAVTGRASDPDYVDPVAVRQPAEASWSGAAVLTDGAIPQWEGDLFAAALRGGRLWRFPLAADGTVLADQAEQLVVDQGRLRLAVQAPDGSLWVLTSNTDGRGNPAPDDDRILRIGPPAS